MKYLTCIITILLLTPGIMGNSPGIPQAQVIDESYSFENDLEEWALRGDFLDVELHSLVTRSQERASDGITSLRFACPASFQTLLIEKQFSVQPSQVYDVEVDYDFATRVGRDSLSTTIPSSFTLLTGALRRSISQEPWKVFSALQGNAHNGEEVSGNYKWSTRQFAFTARADEQGKLYVIIGLGSSEAFGTFYFDRVHVRITKRPEPFEFFSFENDFEGWAARATDLDFQGNPIPWSVTRTQQLFQDGDNSVQFDLNSLNGNAKVWIEKPFVVEPKKKYRVEVEYSFISQLSARHSKIITGVLKQSPQSSEDLELMSQGQPRESGEPWQRKQYEFNVKSKKSQVLYVVIGIFAQGKGPQVYNFDNVGITLTQE